MYCMSPPSFVDDCTTNELPRIRHPRQKCEGSGLVEELVEVAALRALDAGRAAALAGTALEQRDRVGHPALELGEAALGDPDAAGVAVVDEDGRRSGVEVEVGGEAADVPAVAHCPQGQERDQRVLGRV